jgi:hypothetical protein
MVVKFLSDSEQSDNFGEEDNANNAWDMDKGRAELPPFPFSGKPGLNVRIEDPNNLLDCFELLVTPELAELISRQTNR